MRAVEAYVDQQVTYDVPVYSLCLLYDPTKSHKLGSTVPLKIQLCDENGNITTPLSAAAAGTSSTRAPRA
jgi:hypothetical protein